MAPRSLGSNMAATKCFDPLTCGPASVEPMLHGVPERSAARKSARISSLSPAASTSLNAMALTAAGCACSTARIKTGLGDLRRIASCRVLWCRQACGSVSSIDLMRSSGTQSSMASCEPFLTPISKSIPSFQSGGTDIVVSTPSMQVLKLSPGKLPAGTLVRDARSRSRACSRRA